ncbi:alpha/beta-hydrolase [Gonapodya prolifera JEL478]|uniref:Carboxylic ester hydrolase n=1 Tax=Gonapodya prolifera (strain JEL478) TaxID=1344416 RepID=A0A139AC50_GONPJ|nr:alpha/beta-hydrolase [Gonapodya prolifera JEL478]|eukprot:KXS14376.1 alpha/beta-hydrolase [Gonapodya prolifera JEL478]
MESTSLSSVKLHRGQTGCLWRRTAHVLLPSVMVWVHGGSFTSGAAALYNATLLSSSYNVIVVTINYRLNIFGFLGSQELIDEAGKSGINFGIQDTATALQWVQDNIAGFGGDVKSVTVFGESAGAIDIAWILSNPKYEGLFNRAILESGAGGTLEAQTVTSTYGTAIFNGALSYFNISSTDTAKSKLEKLRKIPASNITGYYVASKSTFAYPVIDNVSVLDKSLRALALGKFVKKLDGILLGTNTNEGSVFALALNYTTASDLRKQLSALDAAAPGLDAQVWYNEWDRIQADVYIGNGTGNFTAEFEANSNYITDSGFVVPIRKLAQAYVDAGVPVYYYRFDVTSNATLQTYRALYARGYYMGVTHGSEIPFVFSFVPTLSGQAEVNTSRQMASSWAQFARTGNPSNALVGTWPKYTTPSRDVMYFGANGTVSVKAQASLPDFRQEGQAFLEQ